MSCRPSSARDARQVSRTFASGAIRPSRGTPIDCYAHNLSDDPDMRGILISGSDVSCRERLARALRTLSECNDVLVHATDEASLIANICRSIVHSSEYMLAWVGYVDHDDDQSVRFVAAARRDGVPRRTARELGRQRIRPRRDGRGYPHQHHPSDQRHPPSEAHLRRGAGESTSKACAASARSRSSSVARPSARCRSTAANSGASPTPKWSS